MIPKKIYLNYVNEEDVDKTWSEEPISVSDCKMQNREYIDLSQVWHEIMGFDPREEPQDGLWILSETDSGYRTICWGFLTQCTWKQYVERQKVRRWIYINELLPKI